MLREISIFFKLYVLVFEILLEDDISIIVVILREYFNNM